LAIVAVETGYPATNLSNLPIPREAQHHQQAASAAAEAA